MKKGIGLVSIVMVIMILIGTMMVPAHADYEKTEISFEEKFEVLFDLYLKREGLEDYFEINRDFGFVKEELHYICVDFTDTAISEIKNNYGITSNDVYAFADISINEVTYKYYIVACLYVDGEEYDSEELYGDNILEDFLF